MEKKYKKKILALLLSLTLLVTYMPTYMFAYAVDGTDEATVEEVQNDTDLSEPDQVQDVDVIDAPDADSVVDTDDPNDPSEDVPDGDASDADKADNGSGGADVKDKDADGENDADKADDNDGDLDENFGKAEFVKNGDIAAASVQGDATDSESAAATALADDTDLNKKEAREVAATLFAKSATREEGEPTVYPTEADGTYIEDTFRVEWVTNDTVDNNNQDLLYVKPSDNSVQSVKLRVSYALSGEHNYGPGDITITVPGKIFKKRGTDPDAPANYGTMVLPYPQDPSTEKNYNWTYDGVNYTLKNTRTLSAATSGYVEFMIAGLTPSDLIDMQESEPFSAYIQVLTHEGNTIARNSNEVTAQFDTEARISKVTKRAYQAPEIVPASDIPEEQRVPGEEYYVKVDWYATVSVNSNTYFTLDYTDTFVDEDNYEGFVINANNAEGETSSLTKVGAYHDYRIWSSNTFFVSTAYPLSQFPENTEHTFKNNIKFTCIQDDADPVHVDPDDEESDHRLRTTLSSNAQTVWSYIDPGWPVPHGHFMIVKNGNDGKANKNYTHIKQYGTKNISDLHRWGSAPSDDGWYGIYPFALNEIQEDYAENQETGGDNGVLFSYTIDTIGYVMPWMFDPDTYDGPEGLKAPRNSENYTRPVSITSLEKGLCYERDGERLQVGTDYDFVSVEFPEASWIYKAKPARIKANGTFNAVTWDDGTFIYTRDNDASHQPDIELEVQLNGTWVHCATISWKTGAFRATDLHSGASIGDGNIINLPEGTENFRTKVMLQNDPKENEDNRAIQAAINYDVRAVVKLNPTAELVATVAEEFSKTTNPQMYLWNNTELIPERAWLPEDDYDRIIGYHDENDEVITIKKDGYNRLLGYEIETQAFIKKEGKFNAATDVKDGVITVHYSAELEDRSYIKDKDNYLRAISEGRLKVIKHGYWRDLLPEGMTPDLSSISINNGSVVDAYYIQNYKDSGRTLLVVEVSRSENPKFITPSGSEIGYYSDVLTVKFNATMDAQAVLDYAEETEDSAHNKKWRLHNVISFESSNEFLGTVPGYIGEPDNPSVNNHYNSKNAFESADEKGWMTNLNGRTDPSFVYAGVYTIVDMPQGVVNGYAKEVQTNNDGWWSTGLYYKNKEKNARTVYTGGTYSYRLSFVPETDDGIAKDIRMIDSLENYQPVNGNDSIDVDKPEGEYIVPHWKGTFQSVDVRQLKAKGCEPVVYYSTVENLDLQEGVNLDVQPQQYGNMDLNNGSIWVKASDYTGPLSAVRAVAIDASKKTDGSDFELYPGDSISVIINMIAPSGDEANAYIEQKGDWGDSAQAYNNASMLFRSAASSTSDGDSFKKIHNDYTKVGLEPYEISMDKVWSDENNRDGIRPESVTFDLIATTGDGSEAVSETVDTVQLPKVDENGNQIWSHTFTGLAYFATDGQIIRYSLRENPVPDGYTVSLVKKGNIYHFTNKHTPARVEVSGAKKWIGDTEGTRPDKITVKLYKNGRLYSTKSFGADSNGDWNYTFTNLYKYEKGEEIKWTVEEDVTTVPATYISERDGNDFVNTYHPYGDLIIEKKLLDATALTEDQEFELIVRFFTYDENGDEVNDFGVYNYDLYQGDEKIGEGTVSSGETLKIKADQKIHIKEIEQNTSFEIIENYQKGFMLVSSPGSTGVIIPNGTKTAVFTNKYDASGYIELYAYKTLRGQDLKRYNFNYKVYQILDNGNRKLVRTAGNDPGTSYTEQDGTIVSSGQVKLGRISYTEADSYTDTTPYKDFHYLIQETIPEEAEELEDGRFFLNGYIYDTTLYYAKVRVTDNGDGTLSTDLKYTDKKGKEIDPSKVIFNNEYHAEGSIVLHVWKALIGRDLKDEEFLFKLQDEDGNDIHDENGDPITAMNDEYGVVTFPEIYYDEKDDGKTFKYRIVEVKGDDETVQYDKSVYGYIVTVTDAGKGKLQVTAQKADPNNNWTTEDAPLALFENPLYPGGLKITKKVVDSTGEADPNQKFTVKVEFVDSEMETIDVDTDSYTGEYTWDEASQTATFTLGGDESVIINNIPAGTPYRVYELNVAGWSLTGRSNVQSTIEPLVIKEAELTNTYTPNDAYFIFNGIKYLDGKGAPATYTDNNGNSYSFSFTLSWYDPSYDRWWTLQTVNNSDGGFIQFNPIRYKSRNWYESMSPGRRIQFRIVEDTISASGIVTDTQTEYVDVRVTQVDGKYAVSYFYGDDSDEGIVFNNKIKPGELRIKKDGGDLSEYSDTTKDQDFTFEITFKNKEGKPLGEDDKIYYYIEDEDGNIVQNNSKGLFSRIKDWFSDAKEDIKESFNEPLIYTAFGADDDEEVLYQGELYGAPWRINADHELVIGLDGEEYTLTNAAGGQDGGPYYQSGCAWKHCDGINTVTSIRFEGTVHAVGSLYGAFSYLGYNSGSYYPQVTTIDFTNFDTSGVTNMSQMFIRSKSIKTMNIELLNTSNVTDMSYMFQECTFETLNFTGWNTSKVTNMHQMFISNKNLKSLDLSSFDVSSVINFMNMFQGCENLKTLKIGSFVTTSAHTDEWGSSQMGGFNSMFSGCKALEELDLGNFVMSPGVVVASMFSGTTSLQRVNLGPGFLFRKGTGWGNTWNKLLDPPAPYDGWTREDGSSFNGKKVYTADELWAAYDNASTADGDNPMAGWWIWHVPDTQGIVRFDANGGYIEPDAAMYVADFLSENGGTVDTPAEPLVRMPGFELDSWNTEPDGSGTSYPAGATGLENVVNVGEEITLYAQWTKTNKVRYLVKHYLQNNESTWSPTYELADTETVTVDGPGEYVAPLNTYDGYVTPGAQTAYVKEDLDTIIEYHYKRVHYVVAFDGNGATEGRMQSMDMYGNIPAVLNTNTFKREHAVFIGWNTEANGSGDSYSDGQTVINLTDRDGEQVTLYAQWFVIEDTETPETEGTITVTCKAGQTIVIPELPAGTTYTIREISEADGWEYKGIVDDGNGVIRADLTSEATVKNRYTASVEVPLEALKVLEGKDLKEGEFSFELWTESDWNKYLNGTSGGGGNTSKEPINIGAAEKKDKASDTKPIGGDIIIGKDPTPIQTKTNGDVSTDDSGKASVYFDPLYFSTEKDKIVGTTRTYVIREVVGNETGVTYDEHIEYVTITFTDEGHGLLGADVEYWHIDPDTGEKVVDEEGAVFNNKYTPPTGDLKISKVVVGEAVNNLVDTEFEFTIELKDSDGNNLEGVFDGIIFKDGEEDKFKYTAGTSITLGHKDYVIMTGLPDGTSYVVTEKEKKGWANVLAENAQGLIVSGKTAEVTFSNAYEPSGQVELDAIKQLTGKELTEGSFRFGVYDSAEILIREATNGVYDEDGNLDVSAVKFEPITYSEADIGDTFYYTVAELDEDHDGLTIDKTIYTVEVEVSDNGDGTLNAEKRIVLPENSNAIIFKNKYESSNSTGFYGIKTIKGREFLSTDAWTFTVVGEPYRDGDDIYPAPMPEGSEGNKYVFTLDKESGILSGETTAEFEFGTIKFTQADSGRTYTYTITEGGVVKGVTNDTRTYKVNVTVTDDGAGNLNVTKKYTYTRSPDDPTVVQANYAAFTNTYEGPKTKLELTKKLDGYVDAGTDSNVTMAFKIEGFIDGKTEPEFSTHIGMTFSKADVDPETGLYQKTARLTELPALDRVEVTEVYSGNYTPDQPMPVNAIYDADKGLWVVTIDNKHSGYTPGSGVVNKYENGRIVSREGLTRGGGDTSAGGGRN